MVFDFNTAMQAFFRDKYTEVMSYLPFSSYFKVAVLRIHFSIYNDNLKLNIKFYLI